MSDLVDDTENCTDAGNARRLVTRYRGILRYVSQWGWLWWDGKRWARDDEGRVVRCALDTARSILTAAERADDATRRKELANWSLKSEAEPRVRAMITLAEVDPEVATRADAFDADPWQLNTENGVIDLRTATVLPHDAARLITKLAPVKFDPDARSDLWDRFLERVQPDPEMRAFLRRAAGYTLTGSTREEVLLFVHGEGSNGKTRFMEALAATLGPDYSKTADFSLFVVQRNEGPRNDIARLVGARYVKSVEVDDGRRLAEALIKSLTGGDKISARFLFRESFEFDPQFKPWLAANYRPEIRGADHGIWRRILLVPFAERITDEERDKDLGEKLRAETSSILRWALDGCLEWLDIGLCPPTAVRAATDEYRAESDQVGRFIDECCWIDPTATVPARVLYDAYRHWIGVGGLSETMFGRELTRKGFPSVKSGTVKRVGLRLKNSNPDGSDSLDRFGESFHVRAH